MRISALLACALLTCALLTTASCATVSRAELRQETGRCRVLSTGLFGRALVVEGDRAVNPGLFRSVVTVIKSDNTIVRPFIFDLPVGRYEDRRLHYGVLFVSRSSSFVDGTVRHRRGLFTHVYHYSAGCTERQAAVGLAAHLVLEDAAAQNAQNAAIYTR